MENYVGLIVGIENYHDSVTLPPVRYTIEDAQGFRNSLLALGCDPDKLELVPETKATKTTLISKLGEIIRYAKSSDTIVFFYSGHGVFENGHNYLTCVDTSHKIDETAIDINKVLELIETSSCNRAIIFLDCCHSGINFSSYDKGSVSGFSSDDLKYLYATTEHITVFASCKSDETSQVDGERRHGAWSYYVIQALQGNGGAIYDEGLLFSDKLQGFLLSETSNRVRMITVNKRRQTPVKYGKETTDKFIVADLRSLFEARMRKSDVDSIRFESVTFLSTDDDYVRKLPGFKPGNKAPKSVDSYHESWIKKISIEMIEAELDTVSNDLKQEIGYKRTDITTRAIDDGTGTISTPHFDYVIEISQSKADPAKYIITRRLENFSDLKIIFTPAFNKTFRNKFNELDFPFPKAFDVEAFIDQAENITDPPFELSYRSSDTSECSITFSDFSGKIIVSHFSIHIIFNSYASPQFLIENFKDCYKSLLRYGIPTLLE